MTDNFQRPYSQEHIIKQWVDECTGKFIDPITVTDAVITKHGKTLTEVLDLIFGNLRQNKDLLNDLKIRIEDLERYKERFETLSWEFQTLKTKVDAFPNTYATKAELECLNTTLDAIQRQLTSNTALFNTLLQYLMNQGGQGGQGQPIDIADLVGYLRTEDLLDEIRALNKFTENIKSDLTGGTYHPENGLTTLPPTVGGAFYIGDTADSDYRFYFTLNGDVNGDGTVTASDITALYSWLLNDDASQLVNPDVDHDNYITASDVTYVYDVLLGGRSNKVFDKVTQKEYTLPTGTIFVNGNNVYCVMSSNSNKLIGKISNQSADYYNQNAPTSTYNTYNGPGGVRPHSQGTPIDPSTINLTPSEMGELRSKVCRQFGNGNVVNPILLAAMTKSSSQTTEQKTALIEEQLNNGTLNVDTRYDDSAINLEWNGAPQTYAQGIVFLKEGDVQYVEPLGSFVDFKRFVSNPRTNYIDIVLCGANGSFEANTTRFEVKTVASRIPTVNEGAEFGTIYAENTDRNLVFCWIGAHPTFREKPVVIAYRDFLDYFNNNTTVNPGN